MRRLSAVLGAVACAVLPFASATASAACRCVCVQGRSIARCSALDVTEPICSNLCPDPVGQAPIRGSVVGAPLAGGSSVIDPVTGKVKSDEEGGSQPLR